MLKDFFFPETRTEEDSTVTDEPVEPGVYPCPCCRCRTLPVAAEQAAAYICPVCFWEIDPFTTDETVPSDQNHGLSLEEARQNYRTFGAVTRAMKKYCRHPLPEEQPQAEEDL